MIDTAALREKILDLAIRGKLVPQDPSDEPASVLLERIRAEKQQMVKDGKLKAKDIKDDSIIFVGEDNLHYEKFADGTIKCIEDEIPFDLPEGWAWCRLSEIIQLISGQDLTPDRYNSLGEGIPYITGASNLDNGKVMVNRWTTIPTTHSTTGDLLLTVKGSGVGKMAFSDIENAHIARQIMALRCRNNIDNMYLGIVISAIVSKLTAQANGIIPGISRDVILNALSPLPPQNEQIRICEKTNYLLSVIEGIDFCKEELQASIQSSKAKILDLAIRGKLVPQDPNDEPVSILLERIRAEKEELIKQGKIKRDKKESVIFKGEDNSYYLRTGDLVESLEDWCLDELPDSWDVCCLGELCDYGNCVNVDTASIPDSAWILDLEDIEKDTGVILRKIRKAERDAASTKHLFHKGQVLYSKLRPYLNKVVLADEDGYCTSEILPLEFDQVILPQYARYFMMSPAFLRYADKCSYGVKMPRLGTADGKKAIISIPPVEEQKRIVLAIECAFTQLAFILENLS